MRHIVSVIVAILLILIVIILIAYAGIVAGRNGAYTKPVESKQELRCESNSELKLLAITEAGTRVYRVDGPKLIVPLIVVESKTGQVAIR